MVIVEYLHDYEERKKGDRVKMMALPFIRLKKQNIVKRVGSLVSFEKKEEVKEVVKIVKQPQKRGTKKKKR